jgi:hypothetical protein
MAEPQPVPATPADLAARLHEIARLLRESHHFGPEAQAALAQLADDLGHHLAAPPEATHLVESTAQVVEALHHEEGTGPLAAARRRLAEVAAEVEARAPQAAHFARRLLDALADLGI